jgi:ADP-heptose:LPS heptosyltransferase
VTVVALRAAGLGDLLVAVPALRALVRHHRDERVVVLGPDSLRDLVALIDPRLESVHVSAVAPALLLKTSSAEFDALRPRLAVNLHGRGPESHALLLRMRPATLVAYTHPDVHGPSETDIPRLAEWDDDEHEVLRWCRLVSAAGFAADPLDLLLDRRALPAPSTVVPAGATVLHPGATHESRRWPVERWAEVARAEADAGHHVVVTGSADETFLSAAVCALAGLDPDSDLGGATSLLELATLVASAGRVVCADTGVAHLATAFSTPSVVLFGPVSPRVWGPPRDAPWHRTLWAGRQGDPWGASVDPGLLALAVDDVLDALSGLPPAPG